MNAVMRFEDMDLDQQELYKQRIAVGALARIVRRVDKEDGWIDSWIYEMNTYIGNIDVVARIDTRGIRFKNLPYNWPLSALEPA